MAQQIISVIGAGGKSTAMTVLAGQAGPGPVLLTTTTHIFPVSGMHCDLCLMDPGVRQLADALKEHHIVCAGSTAREGKLSILPTEVLAAGLEAAHTVIYEGDGAKRYPLKLHRAGEPVILPETTAVLVVAGLSALGRPIGKTVHRYSLNPVWEDKPEDALGAEFFLHCILETIRSAGVPNDRIRVFLNQKDACTMPGEVILICDRLRQLGFAVRSGSLRQNPAGLLDWVTEKEI